MAETIVGKNEKTEIIKRHLRWAALFLGELRDGLTMVRSVVGMNVPLYLLPPLIDPMPSFLIFF